MFDLNFTITLPSLPLPAYGVIAAVMLLAIVYSAYILKFIFGIFEILWLTLHAGKAFFAMMAGLIFLSSVAPWLIMKIYNSQSPAEIRWTGIVFFGLVVLFLTFIMVLATAGHGETRKEQKKKERQNEPSEAENE